MPTLKETLDDLRWQMEVQYMQGNCTRIEAWIIQSMLVTMFREFLE